MALMFTRTALVFISVFVSDPAVAECWRLPSGQVTSTSVGSTAPVKGAQQIVCPAQQLAQQQAAQKQQQLAQQQAAQKQQQLAQQQAAQKQQMVLSQPAQLPPLNRQPTAGSTPQMVSQSRMAPLFTTCGNGAVLRSILQVYEFGQVVTNVVSFNSACSAHDSCYGARGSKRNKADCDNEFATIATQICNGAVFSRAACLDQKDLFYRAVSKYGGDAFCRARNIDCRLDAKKSDTAGSTMQILGK
jgi:hypothetical protein